MSARKIKRRISNLMYGRLYNANFIWRSAEDHAWDSMAPVGREFGSPDYERLIEQDFNDLQLNLSRIIDICSGSKIEKAYFADPDIGRDTLNVQRALQELGHVVTSEVAAAVWKHYSNGLMASWMSGAETVNSAKRTLCTYCSGK